MKNRFAASTTGTKNVYVTRTLMGYGAEGDGIDDDGPEINAMGAAAAADLVNKQMLIFDAGRTFKITTGQFWTQGIREAVVYGAGATVTIPGGSGFEYGGGYVAAMGTSEHAPINTVSRGATSCTLVTSGDASKLTVGTYVCVAGFNVQGGGDPPNLMFYEYIKITSIAGSTITFDRPLRLTYKSTWQDGGSARLLVTNSQDGIGSKWDSTIRHIGHTVTGDANGGHSKARDVRLQDMSIPCFTPTQAAAAYLKNVTVTTSFLEVDKLIEVFAARDSVVPWIKVQSAAPSMLHLTNVTCTNVSTGLQGTPRHAILIGCTMPELKVGCYYGNSKTLMVQSSTINSVLFTGSSSFDRGGDAGGNNVQSLYSMSGGVITIPRTAWYAQTYPPWPVPGCVGFFGYSTRLFGPSFKVLDVTHDVTNIYVATSLAGSWPTTPGGITTINMHPCSKVTVTGSSGTDRVLADLSNAPAGAPAGTWSRINYTKAHTAVAQAFPFIVGRVIEIRINVLVAHSSAMMAHAFFVPLMTSSGTEVNYDPQIDCSRVAERVITLAGVTGNGGSDGVLTLPPGAWFVGSAFHGFNSLTDISAGGSPFSCTITIRTDQEVTADDDPDYDELVAMAEALN